MGPRLPLLLAEGALHQLLHLCSLAASITARAGRTPQQRIEQLQAGSRRCMPPHAGAGLQQRARQLLLHDAAGAAAAQHRGPGGFQAARALPLLAQRVGRLVEPALVVGILSEK